MFELFESSAIIHSRKHAIIDEATSNCISYYELHTKATAIGEVLRFGLKLSSNDPLVLIMTNRCIGSVVSMLGVLKIGGTYVPIDPSFPPDRQNYMISHSNSRQIIVDPETYKLILSMNVAVPHIVIIDSNGSVVDTIIDNSIALISPISLSLPSQMTDSSIAYILYTSGSTGMPKGVMVTTSGLVNVIQYFIDKLQVSPTDVVLGLTTFCFDISMLETFLPLLSGATLILVSSGTQKQPLKIIETISKYQVSIMQATPTTYDMLLACGWTCDQNIKLLAGGEAFRPSLLPLTQHCHSLYNVYGPTETTIWSSCYQIVKREVSLPRSDFPATAVVPIGVPISQTSFHLVNTEGLIEVADGDEGELCIGGIGVAAGYLHAPDLSSSKFILNPFGDGGLYRTGDLARKLKDGNYVFLGRVDDQIKLHGFRIELGEIEFAISKHATVDKAVALVKNDQLIACITLRTSVHPDPSLSPRINDTPELCASVQECCRRILPHYMVPARVIVVESFPSTPNGKLDRRALAASVPVDERAGSELAPVKSLEPQTARMGRSSGTAPTIEDKRPHSTHSTQSSQSSHRTQSMTAHIRQLVARVNGASVSADSSFVAVGIDSLAAISFQNLVSGSLDGVAVDMAELYSPSSTVASLSTKLFVLLQRTSPKTLVKLHIDRAVDISMPPSSSSSSSSSSAGVGSLFVTGKAAGHSSSLHNLDTATAISISTDSLRSKDEKENVKVKLTRFPLGTALLEKRVFLDGLRGFLVILVTIDHFFVLPFVDGTRIRADTILFLVLNGFTIIAQSLAAEESITALRAQSTSYDKSRDDYSTTDTDTGMGAGMGVGASIRAESVSDGNQHYNHDSPMPKPSGGAAYISSAATSTPSNSFNAWQFLSSRAVALLPFYWLAMLFDIPRVFVCYDKPDIFGGVMHYTTKEWLTLLAVYVPALQLWFDYGYFLDLYYVSLLLGCFVIYSLIRSVVESVRINWKVKLGIVAVIVIILLLLHRDVHDLSAGLGPSEGFTFFFIGGVVAFFVCCWIQSRFSQFRGIISTNILKSWHWNMFTIDGAIDERQEDTQRLLLQPVSSPIQAGYCGVAVALPHHHSSENDKESSSDINTTRETKAGETNLQVPLLEETKDFEDESHQKQSISIAHLQSIQRRHQWTLFGIIFTLPTLQSLIYSVFIDALAASLLFVIFFNHWKARISENPDILLDRVIERVIAPAIFVLLLTATMLRDTAQQCSVFVLLLSRFPVLPLLGQCSLSIYIFQGSLVQYYYNLGVLGVQTNQYPYTCDFINHHAYEYYSLDQPLWVKYTGIAFSVVLSIVIQKFFLDKLITRWLLARPIILVPRHF